MRREKGVNKSIFDIQLFWNPFTVKKDTKYISSKVINWSFARVKLLGIKSVKAIHKIYN